MQITREQLALILKNLSAVEGFLRGVNSHGVPDILECHVVHIVDMIVDMLSKEEHATTNGKDGEPFTTKQGVL